MLDQHEAQAPYRYATPIVEKILGVRLRQPSSNQIESVQNTIQIIGDSLTGDVHHVIPPPRGFLSVPLTKIQIQYLNDDLVHDYAAENVQQQNGLQLVPIQDEGEPMVSVKKLLTENNVHATFSKKPFHDACGEWAGKKRLFYLRAEVAERVLKVCRALNAANMTLHVEDCWRAEKIQEGLFLRRVILLARDFDPADPLKGNLHTDCDWKWVKTVAMSFTAPRPDMAGHQAGAAIDAQLKKLQRDTVEPLGNEYPDGTAVSSMRFPYLTFPQWRTRVIFAETMRFGGFKLLMTEDWHASFGDRGLGYDGKVRMSKARYGPIRDFNRETGEVQTYSPEDAAKFYVRDKQLELLVLKSREKQGGQYAHSVVDLVAEFRAQAMK